MIISSAKPLFIQRHSPHEEDYFILECADDCGFRDMGEAEGRGDTDYNTTQEAILEFASRLLTRQRVLERYILLLSANPSRSLPVALGGGQGTVEVPYDLIFPRYSEAHRELGVPRGYITAENLYRVLTWDSIEREGVIRISGMTHIAACMNFLLDDIVQYDPAFQDIRESRERYAVADDKRRMEARAAWEAEHGRPWGHAPTAGLKYQGTVAHGQSPTYGDESMHNLKRAMTTPPAFLPDSMDQSILVNSAFQAHYSK